MTQLNITREALRKPNQKRRKSCPFAAPNTPEIDYKDYSVTIEACQRDYPYRIFDLECKYKYKYKVKQYFKITKHS